MRLTYLLTVDALDGADTPVTVRMASDTYRADGHNWPRRLKPVLFAARVRMPWLRQSNASAGDIVFNNPDGELDYLQDYALDGRSASLQTWDGSTLRTVLETTIARVETTAREIRLILRGVGEYLAESHPQAVYAGDGSALEGTADIAGQPKPQVWGDVSNATPVLVNYALQIYQVSSLDDCEIYAARDRAVPLTQGSDYASEAELVDPAPSFTPPAGEFRAWRGFARLGSTAQALTLDARQASAEAQDVLAGLVTAAGGTAAAGNPVSPRVGIYLTQPRSTESMLDEIAASIGGFWRIDSAGDVVLQKLQIGTPVAAIRHRQMKAIERTAAGAGENGLPVHRVVVRADRVATVQTDVAASAPQKARWAAEYREFVAESAATKTRHPLSRALVIDTALREGAQTLADELLTLLSTRRDSTRVTVSLADYCGCALGDTITPTHPRFGHAAGRDMVLLGREPDAARDAVTFELWG